MAMARLGVRESRARARARVRARGMNLTFSVVY